MLERVVATWQVHAAHAAACCTPACTSSAPCQCCYAQLGQAAAALTCVESILEGGFKDVSALTSDADLAPIQGPQLTALINK